MMKLLRAIFLINFLLQLQILLLMTNVNCQLSGLTGKAPNLSNVRAFSRISCFDYCNLNPNKCKSFANLTNRILKSCSQSREVNIECTFTKKKYFIG